PCTPTKPILNSKTSSIIGVSWTANNRAANYTVGADGEHARRTCTTSGNSCNITDLPCGSSFEISVTATSSAGQSLPSYSTSLETGAKSFITSLTSPRGKALCHTQDTHCLIGCITCSMNYTVTIEAFSMSGRMSSCTYQGFSSSK
ncbi:hypothetical protein XENOCAPTIV_017588, partial [Xenoophorus captivus]